VIICNYNYGRYIGEAIESVFAQTYPNIELIVIDDGSTDNSRQVIESILKKKTENIKNVVYKYHTNNKGVIDARNDGLESKRGKFFVFVDSDDTIPKNFVDELYNTAVSSKADIVCCDLTLVDSGKTEILKIDAIKKPSIFLSTPICQLVRTSKSKNHTFDPTFNKLANEDNDYFLGLFLAGAKFTKAKNTTYYYNIHADGRNATEGREVEYYKSRLVLFTKYVKDYPEFIDELSEEMAQQRKLNEARNIIRYNEDIIRRQKNELDNIQMSKSYKFAKWILMVRGRGK
jgi:glycosyltransferase involved in cell wall biosynthesis